ncbi:MAG: hypothetical protein Q4C49_02855 [Bacillota bacterium]|nr:hypothetical protein [Bacillota bacterium]
MYHFLFNSIDSEKNHTETKKSLKKSLIALIIILLALVFLEFSDIVSINIIKVSVITIVYILYLIFELKCSSEMRCINDQGLLSKAYQNGQTLKKCLLFSQCILWIFLLGWEGIFPVFLALVLNRSR